MTAVIISITLHVYPCCRFLVSSSSPAWCASLGGVPGVVAGLNGDFHPCHSNAAKYREWSAEDLKPYRTSSPFRRLAYLSLNHQNLRWCCWFIRPTSCLHWFDVWIVLWPINLKSGTPMQTLLSHPYCGGYVLVAGADLRL